MKIRENVFENSQKFPCIILYRELLHGQDSQYKIYILQVWVHYERCINIVLAEHRNK